MHAICCLPNCMGEDCIQDIQHKYPGQAKLNQLASIEPNVHNNNHKDQDGVFWLLPL